MTLADYLAKNYLTADSSEQTEKKSKKRKRKAGGGGTTKSGLIIAEDDITGWEKKNGSADEDTPTTGIKIYRIPLPSPRPTSPLFMFAPNYIPLKKKTD